MKNRNFIIEITIARNQDLAAFLQSRPHDEELGESLDLYERFLLKEGKLTQKEKDDIRCCHLHYLSDLLDSDLPIKTLSEINTSEDDIIRDFCKDQDYLYKAHLSESLIRRFADSYQSVDSLYVNYNMAKILLRYHIMDKALEYYNKALKIALFSIDTFWNNKESVYACSELLFDIVSSEKFNKSSCEKSLFGKMLEYAYLLLSRVILWPENVDDRFYEYDTPITYRHKISSLNKRAEILFKHKDYFNSLIPSYSTPEILSVADYYLAHDFAYIGKQTGRKSLFKRNAKKWYDALTYQDIRPFSTAIIDGKNDSVELAHRFYLKLRKGSYHVNNKEYTSIYQLLINILNEKNVPINKVEEKEIRQYLSDNNIKCFYHFTERENIDNIKKYGGICSLKYCLIHAIEVNTKGDMMTELRDADASYDLEDYARLSFCERHPLIKKRQEAGADLVLLKIKLDIAWRFDTLFSDRDAAIPHLKGGTIDDLKKVRMDAVHKQNLEEWDPDYVYNQAEVMVKSIVPIEYIINIDDPIEISQLESSSSKETEITKENLIRAINTIALLSNLFRNSSYLIASNDGRNEKKRVTMYSFAGILGYLFEEIYGFGNYSSLVDNEMQKHYVIIKSTMSDQDNRTKAISEMANNWSSILQTILEIQNSKTEGCNSFIEIQTEIDHVTGIIEVISGSKCRKPIIGFAKIEDSPQSQFNQDAFSHMVDEAEYNPFGITNEPSLQNFPPLPDMLDIFKAELLLLFNNSDLKKTGEIQTFIFYVYSLVKSYYDNAGYVPKNTVDAIIGQCHQAIKSTSYGWYIPTLDEMKYKVYRALLS